MPRRRDEHLRQIQNLTLPVTHLKGIGAKRAEMLARKGLQTILDLLFFAPIRYQDRTRITPIHAAEEGVPLLVKGEVIRGGEERFFQRRKRLFKIQLRGEESSLELLWFQYRKPHMNRLALPATELLAYGVIRQNRGRRQMIHPDITLLEKGAAAESLGYCPVYSATEGISANMMRTIIRSALDGYLQAIIDPIPREVTHRLGLPNLTEAIKNVHFPPKKMVMDHLAQFDTPFHKRLNFDRFFLVMLIIAFRKKTRLRRSGDIYDVSTGLMKDLEKFFPFKMTPDQLRAIKDVAKDLTSGRPMNRLLLGDVACGKTVIAVVAAYLAARNNFQTAVMVPTQVLANQHFEYFSGLPDAMKFRPVLLTGQISAPERRKIYQKIAAGDYNVIIGTQSLIQEKIRFANLGFVIIDEQHRFGVRERALMDLKGQNPHQLIMTATPIPRTMAITVFGDMDISVIKTYPKGRKPPITQLVNKDQKRNVMEVLEEKLKLGQKAFVICPVIDDSEDRDLKSALGMAEKLKNIFRPRFQTGLIHGRLSPDEKERVMDQFRHGPIDILVGTTVIEVGVDVPKATVMVIEHPERFGLAQLHQLRGRVGRGPDRAICFLILPEKIPEGSVSRLQTLVENHDGFKIAQRDLELRGQGELTGMRQAGVGELNYFDIMQDWDLLSKAKVEAQRLIEADPDLSSPKNLPLKRVVESVLSVPLDF
jgi:ATP-dependent DNA helicase RecG